MILVLLEYFVYFEILMLRQNTISVLEMRGLAQGNINPPTLGTLPLRPLHSGKIWL